MTSEVDEGAAPSSTLAARSLPAPSWWLSGICGSLVLVLVSLVRLPTLRGSVLGNYGWFTTARGTQLNGLILDQIVYLQQTDHFGGHGAATALQPFTSRSLAPWLAGQLGFDAPVALWVVNVSCLVLGTSALARLAMDLTGSRRWTLVATAIWTLSWPVLWYTARAFVDPTAVGLMVCALLALYRRRLLPGLVVFMAAIWAKETAVLLLPVAISREVLANRDTLRRVLRPLAWVAAAAAAYLTAGWLVGTHDSTFAPWIPPDLDNALRLLAMNVSTAGRLLQFVFTIAPAVLGLVLWYRSRQDRPILPDRDAVPLAIGIVAVFALSSWSFFSALWDGRTAWMSLPLGALLIAGWGASREPVIELRRVLRVGAVTGAAFVGIVVVWVLVGGLVHRTIAGDAAAPLQNLEVRFASPEAMGTPSGRTEFSGTGDGGFTADIDGPVLLRVEGEEPVRLSVDGEALHDRPVRSATLLLDRDTPTRVAVSTDGEWTTRVLPIDRATFWEALSAISGDGPQVLVFPGGLVNSVDMRVDGSPEPTVVPVGRCRLGECDPLRRSADGSYTIPAGTEALFIDAAGHWALVPGQLTPADRARVLPGTLHD